MFSTKKLFYQELPLFWLKRYGEHIFLFYKLVYGVNWTNFHIGTRNDHFAVNDIRDKKVGQLLTRAGMRISQYLSEGICRWQAMPSHSRGCWIDATPCFDHAVIFTFSFFKPSIHSLVRYQWSRFDHETGDVQVTAIKKQLIKLSDAVGSLIPCR